MRFTRGEIKRKAKALYSVCSPVVPDWEQIGDVTGGVWREQAADVLQAAAAAAASAPGDGAASDVNANFR